MRIFQRLATLNLKIRSKGPTPQRMIEKATLCLAIGDPDQAIEAVTDLLDEETAKDAVVVRESVWLSALALCLKAAIAEGHVEGAPGVESVPKTDVPALRAKARELLQRIPNLDADETRVLRKLKSGHKLDFIEDLVYLRAD